MSNPISVNYMQRAGESDKDRIREFYEGVLGWERSEIHAGLDVFSSPPEITYGVRYVADAAALLMIDHISRRAGGAGTQKPMKK